MLSHKTDRVNVEKQRLMYDLLCHGLLGLYSKQSKVLKTERLRNQVLTDYFKRRLKDNRYRAVKPDVRRLLGACRSEKVDVEKLLNDLVATAQKVENSLVDARLSKDKISNV